MRRLVFSVFSLFLCTQLAFGASYWVLPDELRGPANFKGLATFDAGADVPAGQSIDLAGATVSGAPTWGSTQTLNTSGNAATATALQTSRTLWGVSFDGTANVTGAPTFGLGITLTGSSNFGSVTIAGSPTWSGAHTFNEPIGVELYNTTGGGDALNFRPSLGAANKFNMSITSYDHSGGGTTAADGLSINAFDGVSISTGSSTIRQERFRVVDTAATFNVPVTVNGKDAAGSYGTSDESFRIASSNSGYAGFQFYTDQTNSLVSIRALKSGGTLTNGLTVTIDSTDVANLKTSAITLSKPVTVGTDNRLTVAWATDTKGEGLRLGTYGAIRSPATGTNALDVDYYTGSVWGTGLSISTAGAVTLGQSGTTTANFHTLNGGAAVYGDSSMRGYTALGNNPGSSVNQNPYYKVVKVQNSFLDGTSPDVIGSLATLGLTRDRIKNVSGWCADISGSTRVFVNSFDSATRVHFYVDASNIYVVYGTNYGSGDSCEAYVWYEAS